MGHQSSINRASVTSYSPEPVDNTPSDVQPPGVDEEPDYNSLEESLTGG